MKCVRIFNICKCFVIFVCVEYAFGITEAAGVECSLPGGARGECVSLPACAQYVALLKESTTTELGLRLTQERRCGFDMNNPKVCCPTTTPVPDVKGGPNLDDSDFVDELPEPGICARHYKAAGDECSLHGGARGECVSLAACAQYVALLKESTTTELGLRLSQERRCGFEGNNPKVCCPTTTPVPDVKGGPNLDDSDFVDELPEPGICARHYINSVPYVWNGKPVTVKTRQLAQWMALLAYKRSPSTWECGGSIITKRHVLTAAHCVRESLYVVRVGELDLAQTEKEFEPMDFYIKKKIRHEQYTKHHNDIAILVLDGTLPIDDPTTRKYIAPVCLPEPGFPYKKNGPDKTFITGWGETEKNGERPTNLLYAYLDILDQDACRSVYSNEALTIDERVFCAGDPGNGRDACNGDSGGPLIGKYYLPEYQAQFYYQLGLISFGYRCSAERYTGVYTNITHFMPWILEKVTGNPEPRQRIKTTLAPIFFAVKPIKPDPS